ncbi:MAG TPA: hypothetical protein VKV06_04765 [Acidimicrobiales bacterium]|nr:hypothetical protein [Acidimicrobiales bacterium]
MAGVALLAASGSDTVAVGVTVVATLVVVALAAGLVYVVSVARRLQRAAADLERRSNELMATLEVAVDRAELQVQRVDDLVGSAELISDAVGQASRTAGMAVSGPVIKAMAFGAGAARAGRRLRDGAPPPATGSRRRRRR